MCINPISWAVVMGHHCQFCWKCISLLNNYRSYIFTFLCLLLSTHDYRQGVGISFTVCFVCVCVCTVTDFSNEDKASGVKFCTAVHRRPRQGITHFYELCSPQKAKMERIGQRASASTTSQRLPFGSRANDSEQMTACGVSACVVIRRSRWTYLFFVFTSVCFQVLPWQRNECMLFWYLCKVLLSFTEQKTL